MTNELQIPEHLKPKLAKEDVVVGVVPQTEHPVALPLDEFQRIGRELGVITVSGTLMDSLKKVGTDLNVAGVVTTANGSAFVSAGFMLPLMAKLSSEALKAEGKRLLEITHAMHKLATAIDKQNRTLKMDTVGQNGSGAPAANRGAQQPPHTHWHFHKHDTGDKAIEIAKPVGRQ